MQVFHRLLSVKHISLLGYSISVLCPMNPDLWPSYPQTDDNIYVSSSAADGISFASTMMSRRVASRIVLRSRELIKLVVGGVSSI